MTKMKKMMPATAKTWKMTTAIAGTAPTNIGTTYTCETNDANASTHAITSAVAQKKSIECVGNCPYSP